MSNTFSALAIEEQYISLRELKGRTAEALLSQKNTIDQQRAAVDKILSEQKGMRLQITAANPAQLVEYLRGQIDDVSKKIAANEVIIAAGGPNKEATEQENNRLVEARQILGQNLNNITSEQSTRNERIEQLSKESDTARALLDREVACDNYLKILTNRIEEKIVSILIPDSQKNYFRLTLSLAYAAIVLLLIGGFYVVITRDAVTRSAVFSQQTGIQFITLFSLVIAIILFGILDILKDKELAALLGGISGYILGKSGTGTERLTSNSGRLGKKLILSTVNFMAPNTINETTGNLREFAVGDRIQITGSANNNRIVTVTSASSNTIQTRERTIQTEPAGATVTLESL